MPEDGISGEAVSKAELEELADLFDKFEFAFDPLSRSAKEAESRFEDRIRQIYEEKIAPNYPHIGLVVFSCKVKTLCRVYLKRNAP
jgi:hypothetical protein